MSSSNLSAALGGLLILAGALVPSNVLVEAVRATPPGADLLRQLLLGAALFRVGLVILGVAIIALWRFPVVAAQPVAETSAPGLDAWSGIALGLLLVSALGLRLYALDSGMWTDELLTYVQYMSWSPGEIVTTYDNQANHVLYTLLARLSFLTFGEGVWALRLPAVLFGVGSVWALYLFASEVATRREGLLSAALLTFSYHHVWFSQNARGYTGLLFWTLLSSWLLVRAVRGGHVRLWLLYALAVSLGAYTHATMVVVAVGQFAVYLTALVRRPRTRSRWWVGALFGFAATGLFTFQLYAPMLPQLLSPPDSPWQGQVTVTAWTSPVWMILELARGMNIGFGSTLLGVAALAIFGVGLLDFARREAAVVWLLVVPALLVLAVILGLGSTLFPRLFFFSMGFGVLVLVHGTLLTAGAAGRALRLDATRSRALGTAVCVGLISVSALSVPRVYAPKQDYEGALHFVEAEKEPGDAVVTIGLTTLPYESFYGLGWQRVDTVEDLDAVRTLAGRTWLLYTMPLLLEATHAELMNSIENDFTIVREFAGTLNGGTISVCLAES